MVCHETYKDPNNNWVAPDEIETIDGKMLKDDKSKKVIVGPSESVSKSKNQLIQKILAKIMVQFSKIIYSFRQSS